ncbi:MAG: hypothetical protein EZS28_027445 [Streblomastix strix]|uniref:Uncharacterized protein n=1 Tax=Streblomastix strix TaxID=222440 RepID=A0A5J4V2T1_9EUKA|nr:MAG: hypothetical protein EZS28_027445 [Streblomastix strix]
MLLIRDHGFVREQISIIGSCGGSCEEKYGIIWSGMRNMRQLFKDMRRKSGERRRDDILELKYVVDEQIEQFGGLSEIDAQQFRFDFEDGGFDQDRFSALGLLSQIINAQIGSQSNLGDDEQDDQDILNHFLEIYNEYTDENEDIICVD